jgi:hypothetical protein
MFDYVAGSPVARAVVLVLWAALVPYRLSRPGASGSYGS